MPFIPHTDADVSRMLALIGVDDIAELFDEIPSGLMADFSTIASGKGEMEVARMLRKSAAKDAHVVCFAGAGAYEHHIPSAVWQICARGEYYTAYTPYQAEASQGTLELIYEFQSMMVALTGMDVSNASMYDGASALAEAVLMSVRANRKSKSRRILVPRSLHPAYREVLQSIVSLQGCDLVEIPFDTNTGITDLAALSRFENTDITALVIPQPNFFGCLEAVDALSDWAADNAAMAIAVVNPLSLGILKPPSQWGHSGVAIVCGEGQPLGVPLSSGGPYFGFMCARQQYLRQMPGRIVGRTTDLDGKEGYVLTLQAREQHIRRAKATSNICTNQGLMVTAATIHMALMGPQGIAKTASACHQNNAALVEKLTAIDGVERMFSASCFHETALRLPMSGQRAILDLAQHRVLAGYDLGSDYPELGDALLVCATEMRTDSEMTDFARLLEARLRA